MRAGLAIILAGLGTLALGGAYALSSDQGRDAAEQSGGALAFPGLAAKLRDIGEVVVDHQGQLFRVTRVGEVWGLPAKGGYPIQQAKLHEVLTGLTELRLTEPRTSEPSEYGRLGVEDPKEATASSSLLRVLDKSGATLAELIVGHRRVRTQGNVPETVYVRRPGEARAWLAEGRLEVDADPQSWIDRDIANIEHGKIAGVSVTRVAPEGGPPLVFARQGEALALTSPSEHPKLDDYKVEDVGRAFETLTLMDVKPAAEQTGQRLGSSRFSTTDGQTISVTLFKVAGDKDAQIWAGFESSGSDAGRVAGEALDKRVHGWTYQVGSWKEAAFLPTLDMLRASDPASPAEAPALAK